MRTIRFWALVVVGLAIAGCGASSDSSGGVTNPGGNNNNGGNTGTPPTGTSGVSVGTSSFSPNNITVAAGTTVTWTWNSCGDDPYGYGTSCVAHDIAFDDGSGLSSGVQSEGSFARTFSTAGTFKYHCTIHGAAMSGQVVVQ